MHGLGSLRLILVVPAITLVAFSAARVEAWNGVGHMAVAKLAFDRLSPAEQAKLAARLAEHPHYARYLSADRPEEISEGAWATMRAGVWPDWVRIPRRFEGNPKTHPVYRFHRGPWHYVNFPYQALQAETKLPDAPLGAPTDILQQLERSVRFSAAATAPDSDAEAELTAEQNRAVRLCWLIHLVGDLHQPLHAATLVDERRLPPPTHEDQGGNLLAVRVEIGAYPTKLHAFWDQILGTDNDPLSILRLAKDLQNDAALTPEKLTELRDTADFRAWAAESYELAARRVYLDGDLPTAVWNDQRPPLPAVDDVPILPVGYERNAREAARRRIVLAAERLAKLLAAAVE